MAGYSSQQTESIHLAAQDAADSPQRKLADALWKIYRRPPRPAAWTLGGNLPWNDPAFSVRMLREHLDDSHGAASRRSSERAAQIDWLWEKLGLQAGSRVVDFTCGPGLYAVALAQRGCTVTGIDFSPASITHARQWASKSGVAEACTFIEQDVRSVQLAHGEYDAALFLYGQMAVFTRADAEALVSNLAHSLRPGGRLCVELLDQDRIDKRDSTWWYTDHSGLWGDGPYLHLGERFWDVEQALSIERFSIVHLITGELTEVNLCDQSYSIDEVERLLSQAGYSNVGTYPDWDGVQVYDAAEWVVYVATL